MASSKANMVKCIKAIGTYDESELADAVGWLDEEQQKSLSELAKSVYNHLKSVKSGKFEPKESKRKKKLQIVTMEEKLSSAVFKIRKALDEYESAAADRDEWHIDFDMGVQFKKMSLEEIKNHHSKLISAESGAERVKLLVYVEKGRMYDYLKYSGFGTWETLCSDLGVCRRTADRYIDFSKIICAYPRLLICGLSFETIIGLYRRLNDYLMVTQDLADRLQQPLKETHTSGVNEFTADMLPGAGSYPEPPNELLTEDADLSPGWQLGDEIIEWRDEDDDIMENK